MRLGMLARCDSAEMEKVQRLGFRCFEWVRFEDSPCGSRNADWKSAANAIGEEAKWRDLRISAIAAWYRNTLDPKQVETARRVMERAIEVAAHLGIRTVGAFVGALIDVTIDERGGGPVYALAEKGIAAAADFWRPLAARARDVGVRIGFEHCPQGPWHQPIAHWNLAGQPALWPQLFETIGFENVGIEWDVGHLVCQLIDPLQNIREFGKRIFHVHAKDGFVNQSLLRRFGLCHPGVAEHRFPGLGQSDWGQIVHELIRAGYDSDLNIEGWHDPVYRERLEESGLMIAKRTLEPLIAGTE
jgi:sugar phosphate isomerase/epimerase